MSLYKGDDDTDIEEKEFSSPAERAKAIAGLEKREEEEFGTKEERAQITADIIEWADRHDNPDEPIIYFDFLQMERFLSPREIAEYLSLEEENVFSVAILDRVIAQSKRLEVTPIEYINALEPLLGDEE